MTFAGTTRHQFLADMADALRADEEIPADRIIPVDEGFRLQETGRVYCTVR